MEGGGTDLHGFEGGDEGQHDVVTRAAGAGQQRTAPAEREETGKGSARTGLEGKAGTVQTARDHRELHQCPKSASNSPTKGLTAPDLCLL